MFEVRTSSPFDDDWKERDEALRKAAGRRSIFSGAGFGVRDHGWRVETWEEAQAMKARLEAVPQVEVSIREETTYD